VARIVKAAAERIGLDVEDFAGHSLRRGFVSQAGADGAADEEISHQTGHRDRRMIQKYTEHTSIWSRNAATKVKI
ncbi:MAG: tyrosine-type recombinase/integrase, partial [Bacteroidota bacterium]